MNRRVFAEDERREPTGSVITLSGSFDGSQSIAEGTSKVILDNVNAVKEENILYVPAGITIELKEGTENGIYFILGQGDLTITGAGSLTGGCGLSTNSGTLTVALSDPGRIDLQTGLIMNYEGSVVIESGTVRLGGDGVTGGMLSALGGDVRINGGEVFVGGSSIGIYSEGKVQFAGGDVTAGGYSMAVMAVGGIEQNNGNPEQMDIIITPNENGDQVAYAATGDGEFAKGFHISEKEIEASEDENLELLSAPASEFSQEVLKAIPEYEEALLQESASDDDIKPDNDRDEDAFVQDEPENAVIPADGKIVAKAPKQLSPVTVTESKTGELMGQENSRTVGGPRDGLNGVLLGAGIAVLAISLVAGILAVVMSGRKKK